tara:strand:- start:58 stop:699 length:642 start_codon:yes stop_codon:yes gene_type:complete
MNDSINVPDKVCEYLIKNAVNPVIMQPGEKQVLTELRQDENSLEFWKNKYQFSNENKTIDYYKANNSFDDLKNDFISYQKRIFTKNSKTLIYLLHKFSFFGAFKKINIFLSDKNENYEYSIFSGLKKIDKTQYDISMHSESLSFIFKNEFGFDTLTVNGCFECDPKNFSKVSKTLAIGSLNSMGLKLNLGIIFKLNIILLFVKKLIVFLRKLK